MNTDIRSTRVPCFGSVLRRFHEISKSLTATNLEYQ